MLPELPTPSFTQLDPAPLALVVCQVRHEPLNFIDPTPWFAVHTALKDFYPTIEPHVVHEVAVDVGPQGIQTSGEPQHGFRLRSQDGAWTLALLPQFFALECTGYTRWTDFNSRFEQLMDAVALHLKPRLEQRLGLRFVDQLNPDGVQDVQGWASKLDEAVAGPLNHSVLGPRISALQSMVQFREGDFEAMLRHGVTPDSPHYMIDTDCARQGGRLFDKNQILEDTKKLHTLAVQVFQLCLRPEYLKTLEATS